MHLLHSDAGPEATETDESRAPCVLDPSTGIQSAPDTPPEPPPPAVERATLILDWDRERSTGTLPRLVPLPLEEAGPAWIAFPHTRYVIAARHRRGRVEHVYITSLVGKRDSLIPAGVVERIVTDGASVALVVDGRPYLYAVDAGTTIDLVARRVLGTSGG